MSERQNYLDALRALLMFLGIPFHASLAYQSGPEDWLVRSAETSDALHYLMLVLHSFRMQCFFALSGYFAYMMLRRSAPVAWWRTRMERLGVPLLFCVLAISPVQMSIMAAGPFMGGDYGWSGWGAELMALMATPSFHWLHHAWFLVDLLLMSCGAALLWPLGRKYSLRPLLRPLHALPTAPLTLLLAAAVSLLCVGVKGIGQVAEAFGIGLVDVGGLNSLVNLERPLIYTPMFALGALLCAEQALLRKLLQVSATLIALLLLLIGVLCALPSDPGAIGKLVHPLLFGSIGVISLQVLLSLAHRWFNEPSSLVRGFVQSSFTVYLLHQPIIGVLALGLLTIGVPAEVEWAAVVLATALLSMAAHRLIAKSAPMLWLFNGIRPKRRAHAARGPERTPILGPVPARR